MLRKTYLDLENEKQRRIELEKKVAELETQAQAYTSAQAQSTQSAQAGLTNGTTGWNVGVDIGDGTVKDFEKRMQEIQRQLYIARGAEATVRKHQEAVSVAIVSGLHIVSIQTDSIGARTIPPREGKMGGRSGAAQGGTSTTSQRRRGKAGSAQSAGSV
jgi:hypothetical protein